MAPRPTYLYVECKCTDPEHLLRFAMDVDEQDEWPPSCDVYAYMSSWLPWWKRIGVAFWFLIGGKPSRYGHFLGTDISAKDAPALVNLLTDYIAEVNRFKERHPNWRVD